MRSSRSTWPPGAQGGPARRQTPIRTDESSTATARRFRSARISWTASRARLSSTRSRRKRACSAAWRRPSPATASRSPRRPATASLALVQVYSDRNPGDFYVFDTVAKKAAHLLPAQWFDPDQMAPSAADRARCARRPGAARLSDHARRAARQEPADGGDAAWRAVRHPGYWGFDDEAQMLATAGYAVLQVNYRGSGGYGRAFSQAGAQRVGRQDAGRPTDATRWAIAAGHRRPDRICIYGASYGGYAALMGVAKEPALYRCAAGYVGVYDLPTMHSRRQAQQRASGRNLSARMDRQGRGRWPRCRPTAWPTASRCRCSWPPVARTSAHRSSTAR